MFRGSCVALVTPFKNGDLDEKRLRELVEFQIANKTAALVPCGSTGESATLSYSEHYRVVEIVVDQARGRIPVIAGTGSNSTTEAIDLTRHARESGADAALVIVPYYNKPTQEGLFQHFLAVARSVDIPLILYNIPSRTGTNLLPSTLARLASRHKNIVGIKESSGNLEQIGEVAALARDRKDFTLFSGDDALALPTLAVGGHGVISVLANIVPRDMAALCARALAGDLKRAQEFHFKMLPLIRALFIETNPVPVKEAMAILGMGSGEVRLPLCRMLPENRARLKRALKGYGALR